MATRIHLVLTEEEKARFERAAQEEGMTLSAWLREAARKRLDESDPPSLTSAGDLRGFFAECDLRETGREPDWEAHRNVIERSRRAGLSET